ncbi:DUF7322 domain-containing protein [Halorubrum vacuolatum]|uniref:DUF7322 domain-containing protein n=1 Tax=Halorubrum vacuolatum TaxID=63740 RepID=A0A238X4X3_HALVU|nr:hypothetical protein [Halorubrum vacuolatum]SNR53957.1 hypothetical protein SAMN06264855_11370 [Halorubrum vacuolatum]
MSPFDEDNEGEISIAEPSDVERRMTPKAPKAPEAPSVKTYDTDGNFAAASDVDSYTLRAFGVSVIYANVALFCLALGPMLYVFEGWTDIGTVVFVVGVLAAIRTYQVYREWKREKAKREGADDHGTDADESAEDTTEAHGSENGDGGDSGSSDAGSNDEETDSKNDGREPTDSGASTGPER